MIAPTDRTYLKFMTYRRGCDDPGESAATTPSTSSLTPASLEDVDLGIDDDQEGPRAATSRDLRESEAFASDAFTLKKFSEFSADDMVRNEPIAPKKKQKHETDRA